MLATKRPRRAVSTEDSLDPRVMTERQQLAFLLRATAPSDSSESSSSCSSSSSDDDEDEEDEPPRRRRVVKRSKTHDSRTSGSMGKTPLDAPPVIYCGRGRPPKNSIKLPRNTQHPYTRPVRMSPRSHNARAPDAAMAAAVAASLKAKKLATSRAVKAERKERAIPVKQEKTSPSNACDVAMLNNSAGALLCALCCDLEPLCDAPLFLCPACDQKYPTQRTLGRVCMT
ncbi:hypothetical protein KXD40_003529 [Peronospora effusa]|uniref:Uncharacterized protein n=2 Tax=Peronospora TaxID=70742 RepID=A0A3M6VEL3_9STRA|nr:hypothetical protein DD238_006981 [Peronospora effusa]CAH0490152.1 unnamed protein product [Peronospora farinosa]RQM13111.1 hypothetical protein DD237_007247 [Peronospora effusa]UIZ22661.1 hypothetical protein KXD40_003529 [Peronospora effusa]CAI5725042.1 unnamed protein product [Peronospora effusa]